MNSEYFGIIGYWLFLGLMGLVILPFMLQEYGDNFRDWTISQFIYFGLACLFFTSAFIFYFIMYLLDCIWGWWIKVYTDSRFDRFMNSKPFQRRTK